MSAADDARAELCGLSERFPRGAAWSLRCIVFGNVPRREFPDTGRGRWVQKRGVERKVWETEQLRLERLQERFFALRLEFLTTIIAERVREIGPQLIEIDEQLSRRQDTRYLLEHTTN